MADLRLQNGVNRGSSILECSGQLSTFLCLCTSCISVFQHYLPVCCSCWCWQRLRVNELWNFTVNLGISRVFFPSRVVMDTGVNNGRFCVVCLVCWPRIDMDTRKVFVLLRNLKKIWNIFSEIVSIDIIFTVFRHFQYMFQKVSEIYILQYISEIYRNCLDILQEFFKIISEIIFSQIYRKLSEIPSRRGPSGSASCADPAHREHKICLKIWVHLR